MPILVRHYCSRLLEAGLCCQYLNQWSAQAEVRYARCELRCHTIYSPHVPTSLRIRHRRNRGVVLRIDGDDTRCVAT